MKRFMVLVFCLAAMVVFASSVYAETKFDYGVSLRLRQEIWDNVVDFNTLGRPDRNFFRLRISPWVKADFSKDFGIYTKLTTEPKYHFGPFRLNANRDHLDENELVFDNLYVDYKNAFGLPVDFRIGRQEFLGPNTFGEGFLILDGTPGDGSRTFYFNAAKAAIRFAPGYSLDLVYITDPARDIYLPDAHPGVKVQLNTSNERGFVAYGRGKVNENVTIEPYYMYKHEKAFGATSGLDLHTIGARAVFNVAGWNFGGEFAHQFGDYDNGSDRTGNGGYVFVGRKYDAVTWKPEFDLRYVYLSGDDPSTAKNEGWDPLFSRNPYWNELIIYSLPNESSKDSGPIPGYWSNIDILKASVKLNFTPATNLALAYQYLWANENPAAAASTKMFSKDGKDRGHLPTAILNHKFSKNVDGMLQLEYFIPGNYYTSAADNAIFFRWQLQVRI